MKEIEDINRAVKLFFEENPTITVAKPKDLMPICISIGLFEKDHRAGLPLRKILRELDAANKLHLIPSLEPNRKSKNVYWNFYRKIV